MPNSLPGMENTVLNTERRGSPRRRVMSLIYVDLGSLNGGIVANLSEDGLALTAAATLGGNDLGDEILKMRILLPGVDGGIAASGHVVWRSKSRKETGVRFVELESEAREQIRNWLVSQAPANTPRTDQKELPKTKQPPSAAKSRAPKFSFSDVAISRVGEVEETSGRDLDEALSATESQPSESTGGGVFADAKKVVASVFGSTAFTEKRREKVPSGNERQTQPTGSAEKKESHARSASERRLHARRSILLFTYAVLGEDNGGLVFNLSEGGLALTAASILRDHHFEQLRFRFPDSEDWIETNGRLAWMSDSGKEAGIEFVSLPEGARTRIREWVALDTPAPDFQLEENAPRTFHNPVEPLPGLEETPRRPVAPSLKSRASAPRQLKNTASSRAALFASGIRGVFARAAVRKRVSDIKPPLYNVYSARARSALFRTVFAIATLTALFAAGWVATQRGYWNQATEIIKQNTRDAVKAVESKQKPEPATETPAATPPPQQVENDLQQPDTAQSPAPDSVVSADSTLKDNLSDPGAATAPPVEDLKTSDSVRPKPERLVRAAPPRPRPERTLPKTKTPPRYQPIEKSRQEIASVVTPAPPSRNQSIQVTEARPTQASELNAPRSSVNPAKDSNVAPAPSNSSPVHLTSPAVPAEKEKAPVSSSTNPPKQPEAPVSKTAVVTVSFDPFPSIRMPATDNSKKSRQGKNLQMGHLLMRVEPTYPEEAKQRGVEGTVKVHAIFNREGGVQNLISASGPSLLIPAAMKAVQQWRYTPTLLGGKPMETEEDITVDFRLYNSASKN